MVTAEQKRRVYTKDKEKGKVYKEIRKLNSKNNPK